MQGGLARRLVAKPCSWTVKKSVPQNNSFGHRQYRLFERGNGGNRTAKSTIGANVERVALDACSVTRCVNEGDALRDHSPNARRFRRNHQIAAKSAGVRRMVAQSIAFVYAPGDRARVESDPLNIGADGTLGRTVAAVSALEQSVLSMPE